MGKARRKEKDVASDDKVYLQDEFLQCLAVEMELGELVNLPNGVLIQEWIASHTVAFFEHINLIYGTISEFCTMSGCSEMCGPGNKLYLWTDERGKRSKVPAPQYIDYVMTYMQKALNDESIFPTKQDKDFPTSFDVYSRKIYRLLFHVLAHIYHMHFNEIVILDLHKHLNCIYAHLILFNQQFNLIESKDLDILNDLSIALKLVPDNQSNTNQEPMQTSATPEPPVSLNLTSNSLDQYSLDRRDQLQTSNEQSNHQMDLQTSQCFSQVNQTSSVSENTNPQCKRSHSRQHSTSQTISSPTNYIKRFISSFSPNNQTNSLSPNQSCAINEDNNNLCNQVINQSSNTTINNQSKNLGGPFSIRSDDSEQSSLLNSDQENQMQDQTSNNKKIANHLNNKRNSTDTDTKHKYQQSTPIFFGSSFFSSRTNNNKTILLNDSIDSRTNQTDVQSSERVNVIKENTKLLNGEPQIDGQYETRRTTSASAIYLTTTSNVVNQTSPSIFSTTVNNLMPDLNEENLDYSIDDEQTTTMSCNQAIMNDSTNLDMQMETSSTSIRTDDDDTIIRTYATGNRTFGNLEIDNLNENDELDSDSHSRSSDRRSVLAVDLN